MDRLDEIIAEELQSYNRIVEALEERKNEEGIVNISQKHLSELCLIPAITVSKKVNQLQKLGSVEKISQGRYRLLSKDKKHMPHYYVRTLIDLSENGELSLGDYVAQKDIFGFDKPMLHMLNEYVRIVKIKFGGESE
ncbi:hypothetical protein ACIQLG_03885 [Terribacillus saccharophilus]|uniref:hypothetical protein n=1 Tax=Terribacillus saccharophilus TaxID=361277 RepID=UPI0037FC2BC2